MSYVALPYGVPRLAVCVTDFVDQASATVFRYLYPGPKFNIAFSTDFQRNMEHGETILAMYNNYIYFVYMLYFEVYTLDNCVVAYLTKKQNHHTLDHTRRRINFTASSPLLLLYTVYSSTTSSRGLDKKKPQKSRINCHILYGFSSAAVRVTLKLRPAFHRAATCPGCNTFTYRYQCWNCFVKTAEMKVVEGVVFQGSGPRPPFGQHIIYPGQAGRDIVVTHTTR